MRLSEADLGELCELAVSAAGHAGRMIARSRPTEVRHKTEGQSLASQLVTEVDRRSEEIILERLEPTLERFELGQLSEERGDDGSRLSADYFWCIDPLDGTLPYVESSPGFAVSIALVRNDGTPTIGVVYDPTQSTMWHAIAGVGAFRNGSAWSAMTQPQGESLMLFVDRSFLQMGEHDKTVTALEQAANDTGLAGLSVDATGGAVINAIRVLENSPACYFKLPRKTGGGSLWDFAATACLFGELGAIATDIYGDPLELNRPNSTFVNHRGVLFATDEALASQVRKLAQP